MSRSSRFDIIPRDELYDLYIVKNLSLEEIKEIYHCSIDKMYRYQKLYDFKKTEQQKAECRKRTNLKRYGVSAIMNYQPVKDKYKRSVREMGISNINIYDYNKAIKNVKCKCNINLSINSLYDLIHGKNKYLFEQILIFYNRKVTFYEISKLLNCNINLLYELNRIYKCDSYFKWNRSYYEEYLVNHFEIYNIKFEREKTFDGLYGLKGNKLRFDFYLPKFNSCVEYDGEQHYKNPTQKQLEHDKRKNQYCKENNIKLYRLNQYYFKNPIIADRALELIRTDRPIDYNYLERGV